MRRTVKAVKAELEEALKKVYELRLELDKLRSKRGRRTSRWYRQGGYVDESRRIG